MIYLVGEFDFFVWILLCYAIVMAHKTWKIKLYSILVVTHPEKIKLSAQTKHFIQPNFSTCQGAGLDPLGKNGSLAPGDM